MKNESSQGPVPSTQTGVNWLWRAAEALAVIPNVILHTGCGKRYLGLQALLAVPLMLFFTLLFPGHDMRPMLGLLILYVVACAVARARSFSPHRRGREFIHSRYTGRPRLMYFLPHWQEIRVKRLEVLLVAIDGILLIPLSPPLGVFLMAAAVALLTTINLREVYEQHRAWDMKDAVIEQTNIAERFRDMQDK